MTMPCRTLSSARATLTLLLAAPVLAAAPEKAHSAGENQADALALETQINGELLRLEGMLDPVSMGLVRDNQAMWADWLRITLKQGEAIVAGGRGSAGDLAEAAVSIRQQRVAFLQTIKAQSPQGVRGGWANGLTEVLLDLHDDGQAKLVSITHVVGSRSAVCMVKGSVRQEQEGVTITSKAHPDRPIRVRREGIALAIEDANSPGATTPSYCKEGGQMSGVYFHIDGAEKIMPWLLN